jgi:TPP-dependent pyruvate/acetoin dehydrogenase alpha subunit
MTPTSRTSAVNDIYMFVRGYGMASMQIDGNDVEAVYQAVSQAADHVRDDRGPVYIEGITYRLSGHMAKDLETYRTKEEIQRQRTHEPLVVLRTKLLARNVSDSTLEKIRNTVEAEVAAAVEFAQNSPWPHPAEAYTDVYAV